MQKHSCPEKHPAFSTVILCMLFVFASDQFCLSRESKEADKTRERGSLAYSNQSLSKRGKKIHLEFIPEYASGSTNQESQAAQPTQSSLDLSNSTLKQTAITRQDSDPKKSGAGSKEQDYFERLARMQAKNLLKSKLSEPKQKDLTVLIESANRIRVISGGEFNGKTLGSKVLLDTKNSAAIESLKRSLQIKENPDCYEQDLCLGDPSIEILKNKKRLAVLGYHHGRSLRWSKKWRFDARLRDGDELAEWFAAQNIPEPKQALLAESKEKRRSAHDLQKWLLAMPSCLREYGSQMLSQASMYLVFSPEPNSIDTQSPPSPAGDLETKLSEVLHSSFKNKDDLILSLMQWYASGTGDWTAYPAYEDLPARILLSFDTEAILETIERNDLSGPELEGTARFFSSYTFLSSKPHDRSLLSKQLKKRLLTSCLEFESKDKQLRASQAFAETETN